MIGSTLQGKITFHFIKKLDTSQKYFVPSIFMCDSAPVFVKVAQFCLMMWRLSLKLDFRYLRVALWQIVPEWSVNQHFQRIPALKVHCSFCQNRGSQHIISEIENVPNYLRVQWLEKGCGGQSQSFWLTQHPLHQVGSPTCIWIPQQSPRRETFEIYLYNLTIGRITRVAKVNLTLLTLPLLIFLHLKKSQKVSAIH